MLTSCDLLALILAYFLLHERLLDYFDSEGSFIAMAGENLFRYGLLATPEYQFFGDTAPSSPYYVSYFFAGLGVLLFGHTSLGAVAHMKFFTLLTTLGTYSWARLLFRDRVSAWVACAFLLLFPFSREFVTMRGDAVSTFFGWGGLAVLLAVTRQPRQNGEAGDHGWSMRKVFLTSLGAGVSVALSFFAHPLGFQFYGVAALLLLIWSHGLWGWARSRQAWGFVAGFGGVALVFAVFIINWERYLIFAGHFGSYATQFWPLSQFWTTLCRQAAAVSGPFFFLFDLVSWAPLYGTMDSDPWYVSVILGVAVLGLCMAVIREFRRGAGERPMLLLAILFVWFLFLYIFSVPAYRQYIVHALPLLGLMMAATFKTALEFLPRNLFARQVSAQRLLAGALILALAVPCASNLWQGQTLFNAPRRYTLIQDTIQKVQSVIPAGSRVITPANMMALFPHCLVRSELALLQFRHPPIPPYLAEQQSRDHIIDPISYDQTTSLQNNLNVRYHFLRFVPHFIVSSQYAEINAGNPLAWIKARIRLPPPSTQRPKEEVLKVYEVNYCEWPFKAIGEGARLYPSLSDPISAIRYRRFLMQGMAREVVKPVCQLTARAGGDRQAAMPLEADTAVVALDGSGSACQQGNIISYRWQENYRDIAEGERAQIKLPYGDHILHLVVKDSQGRSSRDAMLVQVGLDTSGYKNHALAVNGGRASAHLSHSGLAPGNLIDGVTSGQGMNITWLSEPSLSSWWQVDMQVPRLIRFIVINFRSDYPNAPQANDFEIWGGDSPDLMDHVVLARRLGDQPFPPGNIWKAAVAGEEKYRYLRVVKRSRAHTAMVEFSAYGPE